jgi:two-component system, response regulator PdtaR
MESKRQDFSKSGFELLYEISRAITSDRYLEEVLLLIVGMTADVTGSKICSLMLLDESKQELTIEATQSLSEQYRKKPPIKVGESASGRAVLEKKPVIVSDVTSDKIYKYPAIAKAEGLKTLISIPMMIKSRVIGVLNCYTESEHDYSSEEIRILSGVANQAAVAIENKTLLTEKAAAIQKLEIRKKVDKAKSILIKKHGLKEEEAHQMMQRKSMERRCPVQEVAEAIILADQMKP